MIRGALILLCIIFGCAGGCLNDSHEDTPASQNATPTPTTSYPISKEEAREIALNDPEVQEKIRGYSIETEVRTGQMGPPDAEISYIVYIHVFDPETGEQIITHLVAVSYEGEITSKYYLTPSKVVGVPISDSGWRSLMAYGFGPISSLSICQVRERHNV